MNFVVKIDSNVSEDEWDAQLAKSPYATAFQSAYFFKPNQVAYGSKPIFIKVMDDANNLVGQLSAIINFKEIRTVSNPLSTLLINHFNLGSIIHWKHGPIIHDEKNHLAISKIIFETIDKICHENKINIIKGNSPPLDPNFSELFFHKFGYVVTAWKNYIIKLPHSPEEYLSSLHNKIRYDIRKSEKNNLTFEIAENIDTINEFGMIKYSKRGENAEKTLHEGKKAVQSAWDNHFNKGIRKLFLARHEGKIISGVSVLIFNKMLCHTTVTNTSSKNLQGGSFLTWNSIKWAIGNNIELLDLGGANPSPKNEKEKGIDHYKSKWNGVEYNTFNFLKVVNKKKSKLSGLLRRL